MAIDLEALELVAKAAGPASGLGTWDATGCVVWFPDGDAAFEAGYERHPRPVGVSFANVGAWPDAIDEDAIGAYIAAVCPDNVLTMIARIRDLEAELAARNKRAQSGAVPTEWHEFVERVSKQKPEKPDYWSSCGQCEHNISDAEDLIAAAPQAMGGEE